MLPLPPFALHSPSTLAEALAVVSQLGPDAIVIAGGTDVLPNMKRGLLAPRHLVSLARVRSLVGVERVGDALRLGAMTSLDVIATEPLVRADAPALAEAAAAVGGPHHRRMGTLGGNLCLDTRCRYFDQSEFWRRALGYCLKRDGTVCHVVPGGRRCVAAASNDTAAALLALDATVELVGAAGAREVAVADFYVADGLRNTVRRDGELVVAVRVPLCEGRRSAYEKLRRRGAIDFPLLSVAARADVTDGRVNALEVVVSALAARPRRFAHLDSLVDGCAPSDVPRAEIARAVQKECTPIANLDADVAWRKQMVHVLVERALRRIGLGA